jgi:hypothetical protein
MLPRWAVDGISVRLDDDEMKHPLLSARRHLRGRDLIHGIPATLAALINWIVLLSGGAVEPKHPHH